ncbi:MAG: methyltransferase domain-containing protein [Acidobacteria bacterium]|nr:methyltransferase domain-containing protein [Acidobacteriota bacterium]
MPLKGQSSQEEIAAHLGNLVRSEINRNGDYDLEEWIQTCLQVHAGEQVLDVGCGDGKQAAVFAGLVGESGQVTAADIFCRVPGLLEKAQARLGNQKNVVLLDHDASLPFPRPSESYDVITCCYSIYYVDDIRPALREFYRLLKKPGRCFIVGPSWNNSREFYGLNREITGQDLPANFAFRLWRLNNEAVPASYEIFDRVEVSPFVNRIYFRGQQGVKSLEDYYRSTLLFHEESSDPAQREQFVQELLRRVKMEIEKSGSFIIFKRALGLTLYKERRG